MALLEVDRVVAISLAELEVKNALDVGTGTAVFAEAFANLGLDVTGIDLNPEMTEWARRHVPVDGWRTHRKFLGSQHPFGHLDGHDAATRADFTVRGQGGDHRDLASFHFLDPRADL
jgi:ribosomal protein L11 methylase PrmA